MPTTRGSRRASATSDWPKTCVYCSFGAGPLRGLADPRLRGRRAVDDGAGLGGVPLLHARQAALLGGGEPAALDRRDVDDDGAVGRQRLGQRDAQRTDVVAVDDAGVRPVELLPEQPGGPERLDRLLQLRPETLERRAGEREVDEATLDALAGVPELRVQPDAVEVARERADVRRDRHAVVVEHDDDRRPEPAGVVDRLERDAAGHGAVTDDGDDLARVGLAAQPHGLLEAHRVADRGRRVPGAHDVVLALGDRAERREALVLADRRELVAPAGEDLVRVRLVADVPEDLVARRVHQRVQRDGQLARAEVGAEVAADLADRVDDVAADLLRDLDELLLAQGVQVLRAVDVVEEARGHEVRVKMKSVICSSSVAAPPAACSRRSRACACEAAASSRAPSRPYSETYVLRP